MAGEKLNACKLAIETVIDELDGSDELSFITFDNSLQVVFVSQSTGADNKEDLKAKVRAITSGGSTHLSGGVTAGALALGCKPLGSFSREGALDHGFLADVPFSDKSPDLRRIFLFSDGDANAGLRSVAELTRLASDINESGATINCFGIGKDFNEDVMQGMSRAGHGFYTYIKKPKNAKSYVQESLANLKALLGTNSSLTVSGASKSTAKVIRIFDHEGLVANLKDMRQKNKIVLVVEAEVEPSKEGAESESFLEWKLEYTDAESGELVTMTGHVEAKCTQNPHIIQFDSAARSAVIQLETGEMDEQIVLLLDQGKRAEAVELKRKVVGLLREAAELAPESFAAQMLKGAEKTLKQLESTRSTNKVRKAAAYAGYLQRRCSVTAMEQMHNYVIQSSSSSEEDQPTQGRRSSFNMRSVPQSYTLQELSDSDSGTDDDEGDLQQQQQQQQQQQRQQQQQQQFPAYFNHEI